MGVGFVPARTLHDETCALPHGNLNGAHGKARDEAQ
jgi:hypothetical protein